MLVFIKISNVSLLHKHHKQYNQLKFYEGANRMETDLEAMRFGKSTVRANLEQAAVDGKLNIQLDGSFLLSPQTQSANYLQVKSSENMDCQFLNGFLFKLAYNRTAVPNGCRNCYKVKAVPSDFRGLIALRGILEDAPYTSKCGVDFFNPHSRDNYAGFLYLDGLIAARDAYRDLRERFNAHPDLADKASLTIKRGCSNYEAACGPSDQWTFQDDMSKLEDGLKARIKKEPSTPVTYHLRKMYSMLAWLQIAYNLKDDSYLAFTGGKQLHPSTLSYPLLEPTDKT
jgi:hypothetical protein